MRKQTIAIATKGYKKGGTQILGASYGVSEPWLENHNGEVREGNDNDSI